MILEFADLQDVDIAVMKKMMRQAVARSSMYGFVLQTMPGYQMGWVHEEICSELDAFLDAVMAKQSPRLMITMPPRHGKSELATRRFPANPPTGISKHHAGRCFGK